MIPGTGAPVPAGTPGSIMEAFKPGTEPGANLGILDVDAGPSAQQATPASVGRTSASQPIVTTIGSGTGGLY